MARLDGGTLPCPSSISGAPQRWFSDRALLLGRIYCPSAPPPSAENHSSRVITLLFSSKETKAGSSEGLFCSWQGWDLTPHLPCSARFPALFQLFEWRHKQKCIWVCGQESVWRGYPRFYSEQQSKLLWTQPHPISRTH